MAKIISFDPARKKHPAPRQQHKQGCRHRQVTAYTVYRTVHCSLCGTELDPFDVLVDMLKARVSADAGREEKRMDRETEKRTGGKPDREGPGPE